jgi:hypothetical protein
MAPVFRVSFFKVLHDHYGRRHDCLQRALEISAADEAAAMKTAKQQFAELSGIPEWNLWADYAKVELLAHRKRMLHAADDGNSRPRFKAPRHGRGFR